MNSSSNINIFARIDENLCRIGPVVLTTVAIVGNSIVFYILTRPKFLKESIFRYFLCSETVASLKLALLWIYNSPIILNWKAPTLFCNLITYVLYTLYDLYPWISAINSIDRVFTLKYPSRFQFIKKFKYQALAVIVILLILMLINVPHYLFDGLSNTKFSLCAINDRNIGFYVYLSSLVASVLIPFFIMVFSTFFILHHLVTQKQRVHDNIIDYRREKDFIKSVLSMDLWFLICYSPICIISLSQYTYLFDIYNNADIWRFLFHLFVFLATIETSLNFFLYYFCNKIFKEYFLSMITCRCK